MKQESKENGNDFPIIEQELRGILSQDEIDQLFDAISGDPEAEHFMPSVKDDSTFRVKIYDFKRPDRFSKDQLRTISIMHEFFCRLITVSLSVRLRSFFHVYVASVDPLTFEEFTRSIPHPTTVGVVELSPLMGNIVMEIDPKVSCSIIDLIFGGLGKEAKSQHKLTLIEQAVMKSIFPHLLEGLSSAWSHIADLCPKLIQIETNPHFVQIVPPSEMGFMVTLEVKVGDNEGAFNIFYPHSVISPIAKKLYPAYIYENKEGDLTPASQEKDFNPFAWEDIPVKLTAELFRGDYSIREVVNWREKSIILPLRQFEPNNCYLILGGRRVWKCKILKDHKCFFKKIEITGKTENSFGAEGKKMSFNQLDQDVTDALAAVKVTVSVEMGTTEMPLKRLFKVREGSFIELNELAGEPLSIKANGVTIAKGEAVVIEEHFAIRVCEMLTKFDSRGKLEEKPIETTEAGA